MQKIVYIVGPTASGKTDLALEIAKKYSGELVSADSVQVYKGLDIISGKDIPEGYSFVPLPQFSKEEIYAGYFSNSSLPPIYLLDLVEPRFSFTVTHYQDLASKIVDFIAQKDKLPIVVGGTGLYVNSLIHRLDVVPEPNYELRKKLTGLTVTELQEALNNLDNKKLNSMNQSDRSNPRRLIRAIEVISNSHHIQPTTYNPSTESLAIGLMCDREILKSRIDLRVAKRFEQGAIEEVKKLFEDYDNLSPQVKDANGYKQLFSYLRNEVDLEEAIYRWKISEYRHAKNQMTWFKKYGNVVWFDIQDKDYKVDIEKEIDEFLR